VEVVVSREDWGFVIFIALLFFLFWGDPDVWDGLQALVMRKLSA